jgi:hypothetical protein
MGAYYPGTIGTGPTRQMPYRTAEATSNSTDNINGAKSWINTGNFLELWHSHLNHFPLEISQNYRVFQFSILIHGYLAMSPFSPN